MTQETCKALAELERKAVKNELAETFTGGWDHFLECIDFKHSFLDAQAIGWMNEVSILQSQLKKGDYNEKTKS